jgi:hypothetical protein
VKTITVVFQHLLAWVIFGFGLISPLTPSDGIPRRADLLIFVGGPVALLVGAIMMSRRWPARLLATAEIGAILVAASRLLWLQYRTS